jgi:hypothetical protein
MFAGSAMAQLSVFTGDTTGAPTFNRPIANLAGLSSVGTDNPFVVVPFAVSQNSTYTFTLLAAPSDPQNPASAPSWDTFLFIYSSFSPASPLANAIVANDDTNGLGSNSRIAAVALQANTVYYAVVTGYAPVDFGQFALLGDHAPDFSGSVSFIPAPGAAAMLGLGSLVATRRRRSA